MPTLVLRNVPGDLYQQLKETAAEHRRSMTQEAILALQKTLQGGLDSAPKPEYEEALDWLRRAVWTLPVLDQRSDEDILGYNANGYCD